MSEMTAEREAEVGEYAQRLTVERIHDNVATRAMVTPSENISPRVIEKLLYEIEDLRYQRDRLLVVNSQEVVTLKERNAMIHELTRQLKKLDPEGHRRAAMTTAGKRGK